jgi:hypothetical protein
MMNPLIIVAAISFFVGMFGYVLFVFWLRPVTGYRKVKRRLVKDLNAGEVKADEKSAYSRDSLRARKSAWKQHAAAMTAVYEERLPDWYKLTLTRRGESPRDAAKHLMALANIQNPQHAAKRIAEIKACLNVK